MSRTYPDTDVTDPDDAFAPPDDTEPSEPITDF